MRGHNFNDRWSRSDQYEHMMEQLAAQAETRAAYQRASRERQARREQENRIERITVMTTVEWCSIADTETDIPHQVPGHPFPSTDPDMQHFTQTRTVEVPTGNNYGRPTFQDRQEVTTELYMCGYHWRKQNPFQAAPKTAINAEYAKSEQNEEYLRGYGDGEMNR